MKLEEKKIFEIINGTNKGIYSKADLKEALGGKKLDMIFDEPTVEAILDNFINTGKLHDLIPNENGIDILEGLLNNHIQTNLSDFYLIKPDYILSLPPEEQKNLANSISNGKQDLSIALQNLWSKGIKTKACTTKETDNVSMVMLEIDENNIRAQDIVQKLSEQENIDSFSSYNGAKEKNFSVTLSGNKLYNYLQDLDNIPNPQSHKRNIFEASLKKSLEFLNEMYNSYSQNEFDTTEVLEEILHAEKLLQEITNRDTQKQEQNQEIEFHNSIQEKNSNITQLKKQNTFSKIFSKIRSKFSSFFGKSTNKTTNSNHQVLETDTIPEAIKRKPWELNTEEKIKTQINTAKIIENYGKSIGKQTDNKKDNPPLPKNTNPEK